MLLGNGRRGVESRVTVRYRRGRVWKTAKLALSNKYMTH